VDKLAEATDSIYHSLLRTAERVPDGVRWQTLSYRNAPQYDTSLFNGVAGVSLFLADYARYKEPDVALELAAGALRWCTAPDRPASLAPLGEGSANPSSLYAGAAGLGLAWLRLAASLRALGRQGEAANALAQAAAQGDRLGASDPGPWTEFGRGAAGEGMFLVRLWQATSAQRHLTAAVARAEWLSAHAVRDARGTHWLRVIERGNSRALPRTGWTVGNAGIGAFLLALHEATREERWAALTHAAAQTLLAEARSDVRVGTGLAWPYVVGGGDDLARCQWCGGAPGIGVFLARAHATLGDGRYLSAAIGAADATFAHGDVRANASVCHGLAGNAEIFLTLYRVTGERPWWDRARDFAHRCLAYRTSTAEGDLWQADEPGISSPDFFCGAAGTGHFFLRLALWPELDLPFA
jgi:lantibiotic modifying enzyme